MSGDAMRWVQALVRLWDRERRGYTMRQVAAEAGMDSTPPTPAELANMAVSRTPDYAVCAAPALDAGMVEVVGGSDIGLLFVPVLG